MATAHRSLSLSRRCVSLSPPCSLCSAARRALAAMAAARPVIPFLKSLGLARADVLKWIKKEEVEHIDGLAHSFRSAQQVLDEAPIMLEAWLAASGRKTEAWRASSDVVAARAQLRAAGQEISARFQEPVRPNTLHAWREASLGRSPLLRPRWRTRPEGRKLRRQPSCSASLGRLEQAWRKGLSLETL